MRRLLLPFSPGWSLQKFVMRTAVPVLGFARITFADPPAETPPTANPERGYLGVTLSEICPEVRAQTPLKDGEGLMIGRVAPDSPAARLGLLHYDILIRFNDQWLMSPAQFVTLVENAGPGAEVEITYLRRGVENSSRIKLDPPPSAPPAVAPLPEEMLSSIIRFLRDNPAAMVAVHRTLAGLSSGTSSVAGPVFQQGSRAVLRDETGEVELTMIGTSQQVRAWDKSGHPIFEGPCNTPAQQEALPPELKSRVELLRQECRATTARQAAPDAAAPDAALEKAQVGTSPGPP